MPSRKRSQGKGRKAKAQAAEAERSPWWLAWAMSRGNQEVQCNHGCGTLPEPGSAAYRFLCDFEEGALGRPMITPWLKGTAHQHKVWADATLRKSIIDVMLRIGTNGILSGRNIYISPRIAVSFAGMILTLEHYKGQSDWSRLDNIDFAFFNSEREGRNLIGGGERELLRFYAKRVPCSCLKGKYIQAKKSLPKTGRCDHCKCTRERKSLMVCSRCNFCHYCCRKCQVANWPEHKPTCDGVMRVKELTTRTKTDAL